MQQLKSQSESLDIQKKQFELYSGQLKQSEKLHDRVEGNLVNNEVAIKIKESLSKRVSIDGYSVQVGVSVGVAVYPDDGESIDTLMSVSDFNMYADKNTQKITIN